MRPLNLGICSSIATWSHAVAVEANPITPPLRLTSTDISVDAEDTVTACSAVSASWASQIKATPTPTVNAKLAHRCLKSVPLDKSGALKFIVEIEPYLEWHSTLAFLKKPPADYFFLSHDVFAALNVIKEKLEADSYGNEYDWQEDLFTKVFSPAHDGNFYVYPDILTNAVEWARPFALVSISEDGSSPPVIKAYDDIISSPHTASTVLFINGIDAETFIEDLAIRSSGYQDADAAYNAMFWTKATAAAKSTGDFHHGGRTRYLYPGEFTSFVFENDSFTELPNVARLKGDWTGVVDGRTFLSRFGPGMDDSSLISTTTAHNTKPLTTTKTAVLGIATSLAGYPQPVIIDKKSSVSGYYIEQPGFEDIAVLVLHSFGSWTPADFQNVVQSFFDAVVDANKTKLVIDVQVNSGGYVLQGYDTFRQIFPDIVQEDISNWRYSPGFKAVSEALSDSCDDYDPETASSALIVQCETVYNWRYGLDRNLEGFKSYNTKFSPVSHNSDNFTDLLRTNFSNPIDTINNTYGLGFDVTGYGSRQNFSRPFGGRENIVLLYDGGCASTCALFASAMKWEAGVKSIAMGGRSRAIGKIQSVGGVKGAQMYSFDSVYRFTQLARRATSNSVIISQLDRFTNYVIKRSSYAAINVKNMILRDKWDDGKPAQFVTELSDCRLYWRADMHRDITNLWKAAVNVAFKGGKCAFGAIDWDDSLR